jgi:hypothetical protein
MPLLWLIVERFFLALDNKGSDGHSWLSDPYFPVEGLLLIQVAYAIPGY